MGAVPYLRLLILTYLNPLSSMFLVVRMSIV